MNISFVSLHMTPIVSPISPASVCLILHSLVACRTRQERIKHKVKQSYAISRSELQTLKLRATTKQEYLLNYGSHIFTDECFRIVYENRTLIVPWVSSRNGTNNINFRISSWLLYFQQNLDSGQSFNETEIYLTCCSDQFPSSVLIHCTLIMR